MGTCFVDIENHFLAPYIFGHIFCKRNHMSFLNQENVKAYENPPPGPVLWFPSFPGATYVHALLENNPVAVAVAVNIILKK